MDTVIDNTLKIYQGADLVFPFVVMNGGVAANITGATFSAMFRWEYADASPVLSLTTAISIVAAASGAAKITVDDALTAAISAPSGSIGVQAMGAVPIYFDVNMVIGAATYRVLRGVGTFFKSALR